MKKVLSAMAVSAFVLTGSAAFAGGPGPQIMDAGCPGECQQQIDELNSSQAQQNEQLGAHGTMLENHEGRITALEQSAYNPWYIRLGVRATFMDDAKDGFSGSVNEMDFDDVGWGGAIAFGRQFGNFRAELEIARQTIDIDSVRIANTGYNIGGDFDLTTFMVNGYYEIPVYGGFSVYGMAGLGMAIVDAEIDVPGAGLPGIAGPGTLGANDNAFAYKAGAGFTYNFNEQWAADLGYEFLGVADTDVADSINSHNIVGSVRFKF
ncbi:MAG: outer membrane protein [Desulfobulbus sp.]|jgi:opacity protein-like surface antigen